MSGLKLYDLMSEMLFDSSDYRQTIFQSFWTNPRSTSGHLIAEDANRKPLNYGRLITRCFVLGNKIPKDTAPDSSASCCPTW